ncbi:MAG: NAD(P)-binding oxidoreductase [Bacteroidia bacterium]
MEHRTVIVFGATGNTGQQICQKLEENDIQHFAFVREGSDEKIKTPNTKFIFGSVLNKDDIEAAFSAYHFTDVVISLGSRDLKNSYIRSKGTKNVLEVLNKLSATCQIHVISALGVGESWSQLNWFSKLICKVLINGTMKDHELQEEAIVNSGLKFHIIRPVALNDGLATGKIIIQNARFLPNNTISRADVAQYLVESLLSNKSGFSSICKE